MTARSALITGASGKMVGILSNLWWPRDIGSMPVLCLTAITRDRPHLSWSHSIETTQLNAREITKVWAKIISWLQTRGVDLIVHHARFPLTYLAATIPGEKSIRPK
jgi:hypothetical protein